MDNIGNIVAIVAIVAMVAFIINKFKPSKGTYQNVYAAMHADASFVILRVSENTDGSLVKVMGKAMQAVSVGDSFRLVDKENKLIDSKVVVEKIDGGSVKSKFIFTLQPNEIGSLFLRVKDNSVYSNVIDTAWILKK